MIDQVKSILLSPLRTLRVCLQDVNQGNIVDMQFPRDTIGGLMVGQQIDVSVLGSCKTYTILSMELAR